MIKRILKQSHFEVIDYGKLKEYGQKIVQINPIHAYTNIEGYGVYLCEVADEEETNND